jgi:hypothetical protein
MGQTMAAEFRTPSSAMTTGQKRNLRATLGGTLIAGRESDVISFTPALDTSQYADNDVLFIATEVPNFVRVAGGRSILRSVTVFDGDDQATEHTLFFTNSATTPGTINGAISGADSVMDDIQTFVRIVAADYEDLINSQVACVGGIDKVIEAAAGSTSIYVWAAVRAGTPTHSAAGNIYKFGIEYLD